MHSVGVSESWHSNTPIGNQCNKHVPPCSGNRRVPKWVETKMPAFHLCLRSSYLLPSSAHVLNHPPTKNNVRAVGTLRCACQCQKNKNRRLHQWYSRGYKLLLMTFLGLINDLTMLIEYVAVEVLRGTRTSPVQSRALFTCIAGVCVLHLVR